VVLESFVLFGERPRPVFLFENHLEQSKTFKKHYKGQTQWRVAHEIPHDAFR